MAFFIGLGPADLRQRLLQAEHLDDRRLALSAGQPEARRRLHDLLHGHQPRRRHVAAAVRLHRRDLRLALRLRPGHARHADRTGGLRRPDASHAGRHPAGWRRRRLLLCFRPDNPFSIAVNVFVASRWSRRRSWPWSPSAGAACRREAGAPPDPARLRQRVGGVIPRRMGRLSGHARHDPVLRAARLGIRTADQRQSRLSPSCPTGSSQQLEASDHCADADPGGGGQGSQPAGGLGPGRLRPARVRLPGLRDVPPGDDPTATDVRGA